MKENILQSLYSINAKDPYSNVECEVKYDEYNVLHGHDYFEFCLITHGSYITSINGTDYIGGANDAYLLRPGDTHKIQNNGENNKHINIMIKSQYFEQACNDISKDLFKTVMGMKRISIKLSQTDHNKIVDLYKNINSNVFDNNLYYKFLINEILFNIIYQSGSFKKHGFTWLNEIQNSLSNEQSLSLSVEDIVKKTHYSHTHLSRLFKQEMGVSMVKYIQDIKLDYAAKYLIYTKKSISEISALIGYHEVSHFNHIFKAKYKITPLEYRKTQSKDGAYLSK